MFKDTQGRYLTKSLFVEFNKVDAKYTLKDNDEGKILSLYRIYMDCMDPTEYKVAVNYFANYDHWLHLCSLVWFAPLIEKWRTELELKIRSNALERIVKLSSTDTRESFQANKYLLEKKWLPTADRTTRKDVQKEVERRHIFTEQDLVYEDYDRIMMKGTDDASSTYN